MITTAFIPLNNIYSKKLSKYNDAQEVIHQLSQHPHLHIRGVIGSGLSILAARFFELSGSSLLVIARDNEQALYLTSEIEDLLGKDHVLYFPDAHRIPYQVERTQNANIVLRTEALQKIFKASHPTLLITHSGALSEKLPRRKDFDRASLVIKVGDQIHGDIYDFFSDKYGFQLVDFVAEPGQYAIRGGIVDVFSYSHETPFRVSLFGKEIERIRAFDLETQLTTTNVEEFNLTGKIHSTDNDGQRVLEHFFHLIPEDTVVFFQEKATSMENIEQLYTKAELEFNKLSKSLSHRPPHLLYMQREELELALKKRKWVDFGFSAGTSRTQDLDFKQLPQPSFNKNFELLAEDLQMRQAQGYTTLMSFSGEKQYERLSTIFDDLGKNIPIQAFTSHFHEGYIDPEKKLLIYTDHQIFDRYHRYQSRDSFAKSEHLTLKDLMSLKVGDYITHIDHGIGKFLGLVKITNEGKTQECFKISYRNGDLLYVSIHSLHKISRFQGADGKEVVLHKLGSPAWKSLKQKTKAKVKQIAFDLIKLYAQRKAVKGFSFSPDSYLQHELEAGFQYEDTPDQLRATQDVKRDMEAEHIMDRLICGDVGFGKTEIAIRAAFKAATDGKQVAVLVPTTILAFQHYRSFSERLKDFPVEIAYLNRFRTAKQKNEILKKLKDGKIDIIIGTHQIVAPSVIYKDLGLLIVDEEHKFGVSVKDKLKSLKANIDTLTLTATPIPRTLQFSLMAARDLSVIKTPPPNRQPVETQSIDFDEEIIRDAISYELQRNGQVYFIHNRIENLREIAGLIQRLVPDARVITGHGQMDGKELEQRIVDFIEGKYDVLVSTTIVESGVDVPNANTIFINDAQRFGMADLHQMRGRVGRSKRKAFCYLIIPPMDLMTSDARKRIEAIEQFSDLGSGFQIAMKDLEIRGAGDLLGAEQSGFINEIGFDTYQKVLQEALEELRDEDLIDLNDEDRKRLLGNKNEFTMETDLEIMITDSYVSSTEERLNLYQELSEICTTEDLENFRHRLKDRFGELPTPTENLLESIHLKWISQELGFKKVIIRGGILLGYFSDNPRDPYFQSETFHRIIRYLSTNPERIQLKEKTQDGSTQYILRMDGANDLYEILCQLEKIKQSLGTE